MLARILLAAAALVAAAWLAVSLHSQHYLDKATTLAFTTPPNHSPERLAAVADALHKANHWTLDTRARVLLADVALARHEPARAVAQARPVLRAEPANIQAWLVLLLAAQQRHDPRAEAAARRHIRQLTPLPR